MSDGALEYREDPLCNRTQYSYDHLAIYKLGHRVKTKTITDPLGRLTVETYDPHSRLSKRELFEQGYHKME